MVREAPRGARRAVQGDALDRHLQRPLPPGDGARRRPRPRAPRLPGHHPREARLLRPAALRLRNARLGGAVSGRDSRHLEARRRRRHPDGRARAELLPRAPRRADRAHAAAERGAEPQGANLNAAGVPRQARRRGPHPQATPEGDRAGALSPPRGHSLRRGDPGDAGDGPRPRGPEIRMLRDGRILGFEKDRTTCRSRAASGSSCPRCAPPIRGRSWSPTASAAGRRSSKRPSDAVSTSRRCSRWPSNREKAARPRGRSWSRLVSDLGDRDPVARHVSRPRFWTRVGTGAARRSATTFRSATRPANATRRCASLVTRRTEEGCAVARMCGARSEGIHWPRCVLTRKVGPRSACPAVAPRQTTTEGRISAIPRSSQGRQAWISAAFGLWWRRRLPRGLPLEVLDHVGHVSASAFDAGGLDRAVEQPAGGPDEGSSLAILGVARRLAHEHDLRVLGALSEDGLGRGPPQVAPVAPLDFLAKLLKVRFVRHGRDQARSVERDELLIRMGAVEAPGVPISTGATARGAHAPRRSRHQRLVHQTEEQLGAAPRRRIWRRSGSRAGESCWRCFSRLRRCRRKVNPSSRWRATARSLPVRLKRAKTPPRRPDACCLPLRTRSMAAHEFGGAKRLLEEVRGALVERKLHLRHVGVSRDRRRRARARPALP